MYLFIDMYLKNLEDAVKSYGLKEFTCSRTNYGIISQMKKDNFFKRDDLIIISTWFGLDQTWRFSKNKMYDLLLMHIKDKINAG